ncbi:discoidin domain-containing protein [Candidatus Pacearchaeota archaeon]|jgi:hypothetical protein|nr:discoidin domain-containing protein [Candidatus Pacearchaeota archaeon]
MADFTNDADFAEITNCTIASGSVTATAMLRVLGGTAMSSGDFEGYPNTNAYDANVSTHWSTPNATVGHWLGYNFGSGKNINRYAIRTRDATSGVMPSAWVIEGSNAANFSSAVTLDTVTGESAFSIGERREYNIDSPGSYQYYRVRFTASGYAAVAEMEWLQYQAGYFLIRTAGKMPIDTGAGNTCDNYTAAHTLTGSPTIQYWHEDCVTEQSWTTPAQVEAGATWAGPYTLTQLKALVNSGKRFRYLKGGITPTAVSDSYDSFSIDVVAVDLLGPTAPTDVKAFKSAFGESLIDLAIPLTTGVEQGGGVYSRTSYKIYNSATELWYVRLANGQWQAETGSEVATDLYMHQDDEEETHIVAGHPSLSANITKLRLCAWDVANNYTCSDDVSILDAEGDEAPASPTALTATAGDEQVTLTVTAASETDTVYARHKTPTGDWSDESETFKSTGSDDIVITGLANAQVYDFAVYAKAGNLTSDWLVVRAMPTGATPLSIEAAIRARLIADTTFAGLVASKIYPQLAPQKAAAPFAVFNRISSDHDIHLRNASGFVSINLQLDYYASTYSDVKDIAEAARVRLHGYSGTIAVGDKSVSVKSCVLTSDMDGFENPPQGAEKGTYRVIHQYQIVYNETVITE